MTKVGGNMEMTQVCGTGSDPDDSVFANNSMMAELRAEARSQPSVAELPGSEPSSADTSVEFGGGATATVKFSVLSLANNTLVLPRKVSDEDDMTECPVQYFSYDPSKPVTDHEAADANSGEEESPEVTPASSASTSMREASPPSASNPPHSTPVNSGTSIGTIPSTESIGVPSSTDLAKESDESGWETMHSMIGLPPMTEPSMTPDVFPSKMQVSRRSLRSASIASPLNEDPSPEVTTCLGGLMMQRSRQFSEADLSTFEPGEESTRAFKLLQPPSFSGQSRLGQMTDNESPDVPVKKVAAAGSDPSLNFGDVTTFSPAEESTRAVNKLFSLPSVKLRPQVPAERPISPLASASELAPSAAEAEVDVTRPGSALSDAPPVETMETLEAEMEVTGPPEAAPVIFPTSSQPHPQWKTGVSRLLNEGEESPPKRMRMEEEEEVLNIHKENVPYVETFPRDANEGNNISKVSVRSHLRDPNEEDGKISYEDEQKQLEMTKDAPNTSSVSTSISNHEVSNRSLIGSQKHSTNNKEVPVSIEDMEDVVEEVQDIEHEISRSLHIKETHETSCSKHNIKEVEHIQVEVLEEAKPSEITLSTVAATGVVIEDNIENIVETEVQNVIEEEFVVKDIEISVFHDLATKQAAAGRRDWELVRSDGAMAVFGFMERSLLLLLLLGDQLQPKRSRKSAGRAVNHWTVRDIRLVSTHRGDGSWEESSDDAILDTGGNNCLIIYDLSY